MDFYDYLQKKPLKCYVLPILKKREMGFTCRDCTYFNNDPAWLERAFPGLNALSSAYGTARGEAGICSKCDIYLSPVTSCDHFQHVDHTCPLPFQ